MPNDTGYPLGDGPVLELFAVLLKKRHSRTVSRPPGPTGGLNECFLN